MSMFDATPKGTPQPNVYALVAVCEDWGIGFHGGLLVRNSADMRHFKELTWDHTVLMGRKTLEKLSGFSPTAAPAKYRTHPKPRACRAQ